MKMKVNLLPHPESLNRSAQKEKNKSMINPIPNATKSQKTTIQREKSNSYSSNSKANNTSTSARESIQEKRDKDAKIKEVSDKLSNLKLQIFESREEKQSTSKSTKSQ
jgi:membrane glycosyltransferase